MRFKLGFQTLDHRREWTTLVLPVAEEDIIFYLNFFYIRMRSSPTTGTQKEAKVICLSQAIHNVINIELKLRKCSRLSFSFRK